MHDLGEQPARPSRPSLLSSGSQAEPERARILTSLEGKAGEMAPVTAVQRGRRTWAWGGAAVVAGVLAALAVGGGGEDERGAGRPVVAAARVPAAASSAATAAASTSAPAPTPVKMDASAMAAASGAVASAPGTLADVLHETPEGEAGNPLAALSASASATALASSSSASERNALTHALETPSKAAHPHKAPRKAIELAKVAPKSVKEKPAKTRAANAPDNDVVLLAALMSHMQPRTKKATVTERLEVCKQYNAAGQVQCRARICAGVDAKEGACKTVVSAGIVPADS